MTQLEARRQELERTFDARSARGLTAPAGPPRYKLALLRLIMPRLTRLVRPWLNAGA